MSSPADQMDYRLATENDLPFFYSATLQSYLHGSPRVKAIPVRSFFEGHHKLLGRLLARPDSKLTIACLREEPSVIIGFLLSEGPTLHYVYVKSAFRRMGIARGLWQSVGLQLDGATITHVTRDFLAIKNGNPKMAFNPYLLMENS